MSDLDRVYIAPPDSTQGGAECRPHTLPPVHDSQENWTCGNVLEELPPYCLVHASGLVSVYVEYYLNL